MIHTKRNLLFWFYGFNLATSENKGWQNYIIPLANLIFKFSLPGLLDPHL